MMPSTLRKFGIDKIELAPLMVPSSFAKRSQVVQSIVDASVDDRVRLNVTLLSAPIFYFRKKPARMTVEVSDGSFRFHIVAFGNVTPWKEVETRQKLCVQGKVKQRNGLLYLESPQILHRASSSEIETSYRGDKDNTIKNVIIQMLKDPTQAIDEILSHFYGRSEDDILEEVNAPFFGVADLLSALHTPQNMETAEEAMRVVKRLEVLALIERARVTSKRLSDLKSMIAITWPQCILLASKFPKTITLEQQRAIRDIYSDLSSQVPMNRLLSGDVGTGKTLVIAVTAIAAKLSGAKVAILVPNILLVEEISDFIELHWKDVVRVKRVVSALTEEADPQSSILVGTSALFSRCTKCEFDYVIIDEQQRQGVIQKQTLISQHTNVLEATATCVPRTAGLLLYGAQSISEMRYGHVKRFVKSHLIKTTDRRRVFTALRDVVEQGGQIAIVFPRIEENPETVKFSESNSSMARPCNVTGAISYWERSFPGQVAVLTGRMSAQDKNAVLNDMKCGRFKVLVSTSIIEVGINLPSLKALMVVEADRFGIGQLHQLRGRVGRVDGQGDFYMYLPRLGENYEHETIQRLRLVENCDSGFELAEQDMLQRGFGSLSENDAGQNGAVNGLVFRGMRLMPKDICAV